MKHVKVKVESKVQGYSSQLSDTANGSVHWSQVVTHHITQHTQTQTALGIGTQHSQDTDVRKPVEGQHCSSIKPMSRCCVENIQTVLLLKMRFNRA